VKTKHIEKEKRKSIIVTSAFTKMSRKMLKVYQSFGNTLEFPSSRLMTFCEELAAPT
jgi:hypothetical protein